MKSPNYTDFIQTYKKYNDPIKVLDQYLRIKEYMKQNPTISTYKIAKQTGIPRGRIREWKKGSTPDFIKALETALEKNWLNLNYSDKNFQELNKLVSWIFSGGSISEKNYQPFFSIETTQQEKTLKQILNKLDLSHEVISWEKRDKATEARIKENSSIIGRVLYALGAPVGTKNKNKEIKLPSYLKEKDCPRKIKDDFCYIYVLNRGIEDKNRDLIKIQEERSKEYLNELKELFQETLCKEVKFTKNSVYWKQ